MKDPAFGSLSQSSPESLLISAIFLILLGASSAIVKLIVRVSDQPAAIFEIVLIATLPD